MNFGWVEESYSKGKKKVNTRIAWLYSPTGELYLEQVNVCAKKLVG